jgi:GTP cyclohydrolase I
MDNIDQQKIKKELIALFYLFLENPDDTSVKERAEKVSEKYSGLISYSEHSSKEIVSKNIKNALNSVEDITQYGLFEDDHPAFSKEKIINNIKEQLRKLSSN